MKSLTQQKRYSQTITLILISLNRSLRDFPLQTSQTQFLFHGNY